MCTLTRSKGSAKWSESGSSMTASTLKGVTPANACREAQSAQMGICRPNFHKLQIQIERQKRW